MDTRTKIVSAAEARQRLAGEPAHWVSGFFDPLLAEHVKMLGERAMPGQRLVVDIANPPEPLLPSRARAELVAALAIVDYVVLGEGEKTTEPPSDHGITERFIQRVLERHSAEGRG